MEHLKRWKRPQYYMGPDWPEMFVFLTRHRDSDALGRSNFVVALDTLGGESETVQVIRDSHWACGWVEWIAINESDADALAKAQRMCERLENYPVLDEMHFGQLEWDEASDWWARMSVCDRLEILQRFGLNVFGARHEWIPQDDSGELFQYLCQP